MAHKSGTGRCGTTQLQSKDHDHQHAYDAHFANVGQPLGHRTIRPQHNRAAIAQRNGLWSGRYAKRKMAADLSDRQPSIWLKCLETTKSTDRCPLETPYVYTCLFLAAWPPQHRWPCFESDRFW